jgi:hypothetical protein
LASPVLNWVFQDRVSQTICFGLTLNCNPPDLSLLSSEDYRCEPPATWLVFCFWDRILLTLPGLILNSWSSFLCLLGIWDYKDLQPYLAFNFY